MQAPVRPMRGPDPFDEDAVCEVRLRITDGHMVLEIRGRLDASTLPALSAQFDQLQCTPCEQVVLDVRDVQVIDAVGCNAIAGLTHYVSQRHGTLSIRCTPGAIRGLLVSTGLSDYLVEEIIA